MWGCKQQARNANEWHKHWDLATDDDSLSLLTRCRRVPLVHELLRLTVAVGWSKLANRAVRLEKSSSSIERKLLWSRWQQNTAEPIKKAEFVDKHSSPQYNRFSCFSLQVPQSLNLSATKRTVSLSENVAGEGRCNTNLLRCLHRCCRAAVLPHDCASARRVPCCYRRASSGSPSFAEFTCIDRCRVWCYQVAAVCRTDGSTTWRYPLLPSFLSVFLPILSFLYTYFN